jgi:hypothetical protein
MRQKASGRRSLNAARRLGAVLSADIKGFFIAEHAYWPLLEVAVQSPERQTVIFTQ